MKLLKRLTTVLLAVMLICSSLVAVPVSAEFKDLASNHNAYEAVNVLSKLGVINGYDDGTFKPDNNVTRAEFTAMLLRTRGMGLMGSTSLENPPFPDVVTPDVSWAIGNIRTAQELKIVNGYDDGTFKPNNNVSYEEAVKMIVCALGYGEMGADGAFWYSRYIMSATSLGFLEGAGGAIATPASRATIAKMLYNCLEIKLAENNQITDKTILENDLKLTKNVGYIASNPEISLSTPDPNLRENEIQITAPDSKGIITTEVYNVENIKEYEDMLGAQITFYYTYDRSTDRKTLLMATVERSETLELEASLIEKCDANSISYYKSNDAERLSTAKIAIDSVVVYNGKLYGSTAPTSTFATFYGDKGLNAMPIMGNVELLDRNGDDVYDVVFVNSYDVYYVSAVTTSDYTITDNVLRKDLPGNKIILNPKSENIKFYDVKGTACEFSSIKKGSVVCVMSSNPLNGGAVVKSVVVCNNAITGEITATNTKTGYTIGGKTYKVSPMAPWVNPISGATVTLTAPVRGDKCKFYLDCNGDILLYDKTESANNQQYGYIISYEYDNDAIEGESLDLYVMNAAGKKVVYNFYSKTKIDGSVPTNLADAVTKLQDAAAITGDGPNSTNHTISQAVKFSTTTYKGNTVIDEIVTAKSESNTYEAIPTDKFVYYNPVSVSTSASYNRATKQFTVGTTKINVGSAVIIRVPENKADSTKYKKLAVDDLETRNDYNIEVYDVTGTKTAKLILLYKENTNAGVVKPKSPVLVITDIEESERYILKGYVGKTPKTYELSKEEPNTVATAPTLNIGDVVRLGTDDEGYATVKAENVIFGKNVNRSGSYPKVEAGDGGSDVPDYKIYWGSAFQRDEMSLVVSKNVLVGTEDENSVDYETIQRANLSNAMIYTYDLSASAPSDFITVHEAGENVDKVNSLDLFSSITGAKPAELFIHTSSNAVKTMIIIKR